MTIANARKFRHEEKARADLQALVDHSPLGVLTFDEKTRDLVSLNPETRRIVHGYQMLGRTLADLLGVLTFRRPDGREIPPEELPTERAIRNRGTVRAEEMVIHLPDGRPVNIVVNATPILSEEGEVVSVVATIQDLTPLEEKQRWEFLGNERDVENALDSGGDAVANRRPQDLLA